MFDTFFDCKPRTPVFHPDETTARNYAAQRSAETRSEVRLGHVDGSPIATYAAGRDLADAIDFEDALDASHCFHSPNKNSATPVG